MRTPYCLGLVISAATNKSWRMKEQTAHDEKRQDQIRRASTRLLTIKASGDAMELSFVFASNHRAERDQVPPKFTLSNAEICYYPRWLFARFPVAACLVALLR